MRSKALSNCLIKKHRIIEQIPILFYSITTNELHH
ncbi:hypothetical protein SOVF_149850 [Spinacia oleracea]|nr:hypothetical protein SOVF_149850 [Spinacia oleracea]